VDLAAAYADIGVVAANLLGDNALSWLICL
jgi:hypothetical protein